MTAIERTAYPRFKLQPSAKELADLYTPAADEITFARTQTANKAGIFRLLVLLKSFQRLGYFPKAESIPSRVIVYLRKVLNVPTSIAVIAPLRSQRRYQQALRNYLEVKPFDGTARQVAATAIAQAAKTMDYPADLINVAIEELVKERHELSVFNTLDRLAGNVRSIANTHLFRQIASRLTITEQTFLDTLLLSIPTDPQVTLNLLKSPPKSAKLSHSAQLQAKFDQLMFPRDAQ